MAGMLVVISGPSGSGKGTVVKQLVSEFGYDLSVSVTTRDPRPGEVEGDDYFFISEEQFIQMRKNDELLEYANYVKNYYGTPRSYVEDEIAKGKIVILEINSLGAVQIKERYPEAVFIFLVPPTIGELRNRLVSRNTESIDVIEARLDEVFVDINFIGKHTYIVINDILETAVESVNRIVLAESSKFFRSKDLIKTFLD